MVVRSSKIMLCPTSHIDKSNILIEELKCILKPETKDCLICFHKFYFEEKRVSCSNCQMPMCKKCFAQYIESNPGWCPYCTRHLVFRGVGKDDFSEYGELFEEFISQETFASIIDSNGSVQELKWSNISPKWMSLIMSQ